MIVSGGSTLGAASSVAARCGDESSRVGSRAFLQSSGGLVFASGSEPPIRGEEKPQDGCAVISSPLGEPVSRSATRRHGLGGGAQDPELRRGKEFMRSIRALRWVAVFSTTPGCVTVERRRQIGRTIVARYCISH